MEEESQVEVKGTSDAMAGKSESIYSGITSNTLSEIKSIDILGSFGTKIDTLVRHLLWIRKHDPGAKSVIFSQFKEFIDVLSKAFEHFRISFASFDKPSGVQKFKAEPNIECFLLHAKAQSSGLNLINATHVFLCEPLINTAIELQAIARIHRIGQHQPTTVWMYLVEGTVEKAIYEISVERRMSHIGHTGPTASTKTADNVGIDEDQIEAANSLELQQAPLSRLLAKGQHGGEAVDNDDLWRCLFKQKPQSGPSLPMEMEQEVGRHLRATAAEQRQVQSGVSKVEEDRIMGNES